MKRWTLTLFAFLLTALLLASPVLGEEEAASQNVITAVQEAEEWGSREPVSLWMNAWETIYQVTSQLVFVHVEAVSPNGEPLEDTFRVAWDLSFLEAEDLVPGEYMVQGKILASDSYRFDDSVSPDVSFPILLLEGDPPPQVIVSLDDLSHRYAEAIPVGTDWADYYSSYFSASSWTSSIRCTTDAGTDLYGSIVWEDPMPDTSVAGVIEEPGESLPQYSFLEEDTKDYSLLSGARVLLMLEDADQARFSKNGITVTIPSDALKALSLQADSRFYIEITRPDARHISLVLTVDDVAVTSLPGTVVMVPLEKAPAGSLSLLDAGGSWVSDSIYDSALGVATFSLSAPGVYEVHQSEPDAQQADRTWLLPVLAGAAVLVAAGLAAWFFGRRRRR